MMKFLVLEPLFVCTQLWSPGDILIWDIRCTMRRALPFDEARYGREMCQATVMEVKSATMDVGPIVASG